MAKQARKAKPKYSDEVRAVAKATRELLGPKVKAPGAKQVKAVIAALGDEDPAKAAGLSMTKIKTWATKGDRPDDYKAMREFAEKVGDVWATGRKLAAILVSVESVRKETARVATAA